MVYGWKHGTGFTQFFKKSSGKGLWALPGRWASCAGWARPGTISCDPWCPNLKIYSFDGKHDDPPWVLGSKTLICWTNPYPHNLAWNIVQPENDFKYWMITLDQIFYKDLAFVGDSTGESFIHSKFKPYWPIFLRAMGWTILRYDPDQDVSRTSWPYKASKFCSKRVNGWYCQVFWKVRLCEWIGSKIFERGPWIICELRWTKYLCSLVDWSWSILRPRKTLILVDLMAMAWVWVAETWSIRADLKWQHEITSLVVKIAIFNHIQIYIQSISISYIIYLYIYIHGGIYIATVDYQKVIKTWVNTELIPCRLPSPWLTGGSKLCHSECTSLVRGKSRLFFCTLVALLKYHKTSIWPRSRNTDYERYMVYFVGMGHNSWTPKWLL